MTKRITVKGKTFKVVDGVVEVSMYDLQSRITAIRRKAEENGWKVVYTK